MKVQCTIFTIDSVPQAEQVACCHGDSQTNKPTKRDGRVVPLISTLHNADKASAGPPIGWNFMTSFYFQIYFLNTLHACSPKEFILGNSQYSIDSLVYSD